MDQLGSAKRAVESFKYFAMERFSNLASQKGKRIEAFISRVKLHKVMELISSEIRIKISHALNTRHQP